jgi:hypothetical protein
MRFETVFVMADIFSSSDTAPLNFAINCCTMNYQLVLFLAYNISRNGPHRKHCSVVAFVRGDVFTYPLPRNGRGADHTKHRLSIFAGVT